MNTECGTFEAIDTAVNNIDWSKPISTKDGKFVNSDDGIMIEEYHRICSEWIDEHKKKKSE